MTTFTPHGTVSLTAPFGNSPHVASAVVGTSPWDDSSDSTYSLINNNFETFSGSDIASALAANPIVGAIVSAISVTFRAESTSGSSVPVVLLGDPASVDPTSALPNTSVSGSDSPTWAGGPQEVTIDLDLSEGDFGLFDLSTLGLYFFIATHGTALKIYEVGEINVTYTPLSPKTFTPNTALEYADDRFFGRYGVPVGISVLWNGSTFVERPYPWLGEIRPFEDFDVYGTELIEGVTWFQGGRTYQVSDATATALTTAGFTVI